MSLYKKISAFSIASLLLLSVATVPFVFAQAPEENGAGSGLQLSPTRTEISAQPGERKTFSITLKNVTQGEVTAQAFLNDFESDGSSGTPQIIVDEEAGKDTPYSLKKMLTDLKDVNLKAGETKEIEHTIDVPADAAPGAYFGALRYAAVPLGQETAERQVSLTASVAHLVFVEVPGEVVQQIQIQSVDLKNSSNNNRSFFDEVSRADVNVKNLGNGFSRPFGKVTVSRGGSQVYSYDINNTDPRGIVLPQSNRVFSDEVKNVNTPGKYKIVASVAYGNGGEVVNYEKSFWYLPIWFLAVVLGVIILLIGGGYYGYKKYASGKFGKK